MRLIGEYLGDLKKEFHGYTMATLAKDAMAGLTVAAVALPLALAFGVSSGADAASGLITAIVAGAIASVFAGAFYQISGPTGAMAAILVSLVARYGMQGVFVATGMAGLLLIVAGLLHLGRLTAFIPMPVITGFTSGIAIIIALGQVDNFFGVHSEGASAVEKLVSYGRLGFSPNWTALALGCGVVALMLVFPKKWNAVVPSSLVAIIVATAVSIVAKLDVACVGTIPQTLLPEARLQLTALDTTTVTQLVGPAVSIAVLGMIESLLCGASAGRMTGIKLRSDRELVAQGLANVAAPFFGGIPATAAIARTSVAIKSGAKTRLAGLFHCVGLLVSMLVLAPVMGKIPLAALAGVLMVTAWRMNDWKAIHTIFKGRFKGPMLKYAVTLAATVLFDLTVAIALGVGVALVLLVARLSKLEIVYEKVDPARLDGNLAVHRANTMVAYITGPLLFANTEALSGMPARMAGCDTLLLSMRGVSMLDLSAAGVLQELVTQLQKSGVSVLLCGVSPNVRSMMDRTDITKTVGKENFYWSATRALTGAVAHRD